MLYKRTLITYLSYTCISCQALSNPPKKNKHNAKSDRVMANLAYEVDGTNSDDDFNGFIGIKHLDATNFFNNHV